MLDGVAISKKELSVSGHCSSGKFLTNQVKVQFCPILFHWVIVVMIVTYSDHLISKSAYVYIRTELCKNVSSLYV